MTTYYIKKGRRYVPVEETDPFRDTLPMGYSLIKVSPGHCTYVHNIEPDNATVLAAMTTARNAMVQAMNEATKLIPDTRSVPPSLKKKYEKAWQAWTQIIGSDHPVAFEGVSMWDIVGAGLKALNEQLDKKNSK